jgi:hypothetical protein
MRDVGCLSEAKNNFWRWTLDFGGRCDKVQALVLEKEWQGVKMPHENHK